MKEEGKDPQVVTWEELEKHTVPNDCWFVVDGMVYNATDFLVEHPGGDEILVKWSGLDASAPFANVNHTQYAISLRNARAVGRIESANYPEGYEERLKAKKKQSEKSKKKKHSHIQPVSKQFVKRHMSEEDCWIILENKVYDVTSYLDEHPGGISKIMEFAGIDATAAFESQGHSMTAIKKRDELYIADIQKEGGKMVYLILAAVVVALLVVLSGFL